MVVNISKAQEQGYKPGRAAVAVLNTLRLGEISTEHQSLTVEKSYSDMYMYRGRKHTCNETLDEVGGLDLRVCLAYASSHLKLHMSPRRRKGAL